MTATTIPIRRGQLDLWCVSLAETASSGTVPECDALLSPSEREQEAAFRFEKDRVRYRVTRSAIRVVLSRYVSVHPSSWRFESSRYGRPCLIDKAAFQLPVDFNISHSDELVLICVGFGGRVGVDVESIDRAVADGVEENCLTGREVSALRRLPDQRSQARQFIELWTLKESYLKARGEGLSLPISAFGFEFTPGQISFHSAGVSGHSERWRFVQFHLPHDHVGALCTDGDGLPEICLRELIPLRHEKPMSMRIIRCSAMLSKTADSTR
jgi:4'-phosphopantetheinyl transferase